ncbi:sensor histidine kinase [Rudanella paleaurantiibacter]|uniref:histidine kinase n=1 Tax=Rudanella paleaurantiibacter TaxID=2614655 RepID=A0A7J5TRS9_9BACT|nr:sensor histidine kinase [Rudanella paleaurantiibacter]KAB7725296.1 sensor histidine kinase [Rudanella paleaurantiibacter]
MAKVSRPFLGQVKHLADYLATRRETILNSWRTQCASDGDLHNRLSLSREEFIDQVPVLLNVLQDRLLDKPLSADPTETASEHGWHRWQRGYSLQELLNELDKLYETLADEIDTYLTLYPDTPAPVTALAHRQVLVLAREINRGSVMYYDSLRQTSAAERAEQLQSALDQLNQITRERGEHLRQTSHDLRSSFGALFGAANLLTLPSTPSEQTQYIEILNRNLSSIQHVLLQMTDFARIEAGQEQLTLKPFDAAHLLRDLVKQAQPMSAEQQLVLRADGPDSLPVLSDRGKIQRIIQNLLLSALRHTQQGWVNVSWALESDTRWTLSVQDSGPGLTHGPAALLAEQLSPQIEVPSSQRLTEPEKALSKALPATKGPARSAQKHSEDIGLFIVKQVCEQLKATMEIESSAEGGTLVRISMLTNQEAPSGER